MTPQASQPRDGTSVRSHAHADGDPPDAELLERARVGDDRAVRSIWLRHARWLAGVVLAHKPRHAELEDMLQEVAMRVVARIHTLDEPAALRQWLRTVAVNVCRSDGRRVTRAQRHTPRIANHAQAQADPRDEAPTEFVPEMHDEAERVLRLALDLPEHYREPFLLRTVRGLSYRQIGELLGLPETTIETRLARARRMLSEAAGDPATKGPAS